MEEKINLANTLNYYLSILTILGGVLVLVLALYVGFIFFTKKESKLLKCISNRSLLVVFVSSFLGLILTLFYSEYLRYEPCLLCWYQRVFLYPLPFMFLYAFLKKDRSILPYGLILASIGSLIAFYQHLLQIGFDIMKPCSSAPFAVDCAEPSFIEFGFVTFPFMALVLFSFISLMITISIFYKK